MRKPGQGEDREAGRHAAQHAGDKSSDWRGWYDIAIPLGDDRYDAHLAELPTRSYS
ncbi:hypothetical protein [Pseudofrankia sp. DC12]|uniref:hypothetical protein n=1 Tax=Pseudofrankia sp. DC12 TaxID=683315 RepID=UPI000AAA25E8|nr:hypothetical protein [Pseudofrankia sp. DC12]